MSLPNIQVNLAVAGYPGQWYTPLFFGTVAATGGKFIADAVAALSGERVASSFSLPDWPVRSGFFGSLIYTFLAHWSRLLAPELAEAQTTAAATAPREVGRVVARAPRPRLDTVGCTQVPEQQRLAPLARGGAAGRAAGGRGELYLWEP